MICIGVRLTLGRLKGLIREAILDEVDTDPSNNPGRPADAYEYLGMHPSPTAAMSHPFAGGASADGGADPSQPPDDVGDDEGSPPI